MQILTLEKAVSVLSKDKDSLKKNWLIELPPLSCQFVRGPPSGWGYSRYSLQVVLDNKTFEQWKEIYRLYFGLDYKPELVFFGNKEMPACEGNTLEQRKCLHDFYFGNKYKMEQIILNTSNISMIKTPFGSIDSNELFNTEFLASCFINLKTVSHFNPMMGFVTEVTKEFDLEYCQILTIPCDIGTKELVEIQNRTGIKNVIKNEYINNSHFCKKYLEGINPLYWFSDQNKSETKRRKLIKLSLEKATLLFKKLKALKNNESFDLPDDLANELSNNPNLLNTNYWIIELPQAKCEVKRQIVGCGGPDTYDNLSINIIPDQKTLEQWKEFHFEVDNRPYFFNDKISTYHSKKDNPILFYKSVPFEPIESNSLRCTEFTAIVSLEFYEYTYYHSVEKKCITNKSIRFISCEILTNPVRNDDLKVFTDD